MRIIFTQLIKKTLINVISIIFVSFLYKFLKSTFTIFDFCFIITISLIVCNNKSKFFV